MDSILTQQILVGQDTDLMNSFDKDIVTREAVVEERFPAIPLDDPLLTRHDCHVRFYKDTSLIRYLACQQLQLGVERYEFQPTPHQTLYVAGLQAASVASTVHFIQVHNRYPDNWEPPFHMQWPNFGDNNPQPTVLNAPEEIAEEISFTRQHLSPPYDFDDMMMYHAWLQITIISHGQHSILLKRLPRKFPSPGSTYLRRMILTI